MIFRAICLNELKGGCRAGRPFYFSTSLSRAPVSTSALSNLAQSLSAYVRFMPGSVCKIHLIRRLLCGI